MRGWLKGLGASALLAALAVTSAHAGATPAERAAEVRRYLENGMGPHAALGYQRDRSMPDLSQPLRVDGAYLWSVNLRAGVSYRIYGACDSKCNDIDMEVYGADGMLVDRDVAGDDTPYVQITPTSTGRHFVRVWVFNCEEEPCVIGARVVYGGRPQPRPQHDRADVDYEAVVKAELDASGARQVAAGYTQYGDDVFAPLELDSDGHREPYDLIAGRNYVFVGACDHDCDDVDMEILDPNGRQVASDLASDDRPVVGVTPPRSGAYTVRIWLASCNVEPCYVGLRSFRRERTPRVRQ